MCHAWLCNACAGIHSKSEVKFIEKVTAKVKGLTWTCPKCVKDFHEGDTRTGITYSVKMYENILVKMENQAKEDDKKMDEYMKLLQETRAKLDKEKKANVGLESHNTY